MEPLLLLELVFLLLLMAGAIVAACARDLLVSVVVLCAYSMLMATLYTVMGAPDVAMTEAAVGAGASTLLFFLALKVLGQQETAVAQRNTFVGLAVTVPLFLLLCSVLPDMPPYGSSNSAAHQHVAAYYIEKTATEIAIPNMVTAVLASYRGFDTLGETVVILTAGLAVWLLLGAEKSRTSGSK